MHEKHSIRMMLEEMGIYTYKEYKDKVLLWQQSVGDMKICTGQTKIDALRDIVIDYREQYIQQLKGPFISVDPSIYQDNLIDNYLCLFPNRSLIETSTLMTYDYSCNRISLSHNMPPNDFFKQYFRYENLIKNQIAYLYPIKKNEYMFENATTIFPSDFFEKPYSNIVKIDRTNNLESVIEKSNMFFFKFPWLYNARTDDFIEICDKYPAEFECLANTIEKIVIASNVNNIDFQEDVFYQLKEALSNIQISYEIKKSQLKAKGIAAITGIALTCIPFAVPHFFNNFNPELFQTIIGGSTIAGSVKILNDFNDLKVVGQANPFWVIWKWEKGTHII